MALDDEKFLLNIENNDEAEDTFADDDACQVNDALVYEEHSWPKNDPSPTGFSFKGKKRPFIKVVVENINEKGKFKSS